MPPIRYTRWQLTPTENKIIKSIISGNTSDKEVAKHLIMSRRTVRTHLTSIYAKMDVGDMTAMVLKYIRQEGLELLGNQDGQRTDNAQTGHNHQAA